MWHPSRMIQNHRLFRKAWARAIGATLILAAAASCVAQATMDEHASGISTPPLILVSSKRVQQAREKLAQGDPAFTTPLAQLVALADASLEEPIQTVVDKTSAPPSGDMHDYVSMAPYWWPNPDTEDGLPYIRRDGEVNPERVGYDVTAMSAMNQSVRRLAFAYFFTGDERYAQRAAEWLRAWFVNPATRMNPNLQYGQFIPGVNNGRSIGIIETTRLRWVPDAVAVLGSSSAWSDSDTEAVREWFSDYLDWLLTSEHGLEEAAEENNHGTWYAQQVVLYALFVGNEEAARDTLDTIPARIAAQVEPDGSQPHELARTKPFSYSEYNLRALVDLAFLADRLDVDLWNYQTEDGRGIRAALDYLAPYATDPSSWPAETYPYIGDLLKADMTAQTFRRASVGYDDPDYEEVARSIAGGDLELDWINLLEPPLK